MFPEHMALKEVTEKKHPSISIDLWNDWGVGQKKGMLRTDLALIDYPHEMLLLYYVGCFRFLHRSEKGGN